MNLGNKSLFVRIIFIPEINVMIPPVQAGYSLEVVMIMMTEPEVTENERRMGSEAARYGCSLLT